MRTHETRTILIDWATGVPVRRFQLILPGLYLGWATLCFYVHHVGMDGGALGGAFIGWSLLSVTPLALPMLFAYARLTGHVWPTEAVTYTVLCVAIAITAVLLWALGAWLDRRLFRRPESN